jgi:hypothetical protein
MQQRNEKAESQRRNETPKLRSDNEAWGAFSRSRARLIARRLHPHPTLIKHSGFSDRALRHYETIAGPTGVIWNFSAIAR